MKSRFLFPSVFRRIGWVLFLPGFILGYLIDHGYNIPFLRHKSSGFDAFLFGNFTQSYTDELALTLVVTGLLFIGFSRQKHEDELVARLRLDALYWGVLINYLLGIILIFLATPLYENGRVDFNLGNFIVIAIYNLFTPLLIFIIRFHYLIYFKKDNYIVPALKFLPNKPFRHIGIILICASIVFIVLLNFLENKLDNLHSFGILALYGIISGLLLWAFSLNKEEDELTIQDRLESMQLAVFVNYGLLLLANFTIYSAHFLQIVELNFLSLILFFIIRFTYVCNKNTWSPAKEIKGGLLS